MKLLIFCLVAIVTWVQPASSAPLDQLKKCAAIPVSSERLACYDNLAAVTGEADLPTTEEAWKLETQTSEMDDSTNVYMYVASDNTFPGKYGDEQRAKFFVTCVEGWTNVYFVFGDHFMSELGQFGMARIRIDDQKAQSIQLTVQPTIQRLGYGVTTVSKLSVHCLGRRVY